MESPGKLAIKESSDLGFSGQRQRLLCGGFYVA